MNLLSRTISRGACPSRLNRNFLPIFAALFLHVSTFTMAKDMNSVIYLKNDKIELGILTEVGGRVVHFSKPGGENFLYSDPALWNEPPGDRVVPTSDAVFKAYNGFITWVGPQSQWWNQQSVNSQQKGAAWPPDPFIEYAPFSIVNQTSTTLTIVGPVSPVSGIQFTKTFELISNRVKIDVAAKNCREEPVSWDLWSNLRFDAFTRYKVPTRKEGLLRVSGEKSSVKEPVPYEIADGYFSFKPTKADLKTKESKAFIHPSEGRIVVIKPFGTMTIQFPLLDIKEIHPEQAHVEVYNCISVSGADDLLELEHHSAYKTLLPGEVIELTETWEIE
jgi:hypothetical protein